jgi:hypothetical protein
MVLRYITNSGLQETFELDENQSNLVMIAALTFVFQAVCFYIMNPTKFNFKWCFICFVVAFAYNIAYFKFFITKE